MKDSFNILIAGSQSFDDKQIVSGMLTELYNVARFDKIITSRFAGACQFAREWVAEVNESYGLSIKHADCTFDNHLTARDLSIYDESIDIPNFILEGDPFFKKGKEMLISSGAKLVIAFPNQQCQLGSFTRNIKRFAQLASIPCQDCSPDIAKIYDVRSLNFAQEAEKMNDFGLPNAHPHKSFKS